MTESTGLALSDMSQRLGPPKAGHGRIVLISEKGLSGRLFGWKIDLDGETLPPLKAGTYVYADRTAGRHRLSYSEPLFPVSQRDVSVAPGRTYFFVVRMSERGKKVSAMTVAGGLTGMILTSAITSGDPNPGFLDFFPMEETAARETLADLRQAD